MNNSQIKIGSQIWMSSNLNVCHFRNGDIINEAKTYKEWQEADELSKPAWCYYENNSKYGGKLGKLYNWHAVNDARNLSPENWDLPSDIDFEILSSFLGGSEMAGIKLKNSTDWKDNNQPKNSGFNALPGGARLWSHKFCGLNENAFFWTSTEHNNYFSWHRVLINNYDTFGRVNQGGKGFGMSVRCINCY